MEPSGIEGARYSSQPPTDKPKRSWIELSFLLVVGGLIPLNLLVRED
jgi:hypothetical protein